MNKKNYFEGKRVIISGGSRGIGLSIAKELAKNGANIAILAKTTEPHPKLPGTIFTAAEEIELCGGKALPQAVQSCSNQSPSPLFMVCSS